MSPCARGGAGGAGGEPLPTAGAVPEHPSISRGPRNTPTHARVCEREGKRKLGFCSGAVLLEIFNACVCKRLVLQKTGGNESTLGNWRVPSSPCHPLLDVRSQRGTMEGVPTALSKLFSLLMSPFDIHTYTHIYLTHTGKSAKT